MGAGDYFESHERQQIDAAIRHAEISCRFEFSVFVGDAGTDSRAFATQLHNSLVAPPRSLVIMVDPDAKALEIVTGGQVRAQLPDADVEAVVNQMTEAFRTGQVAEGVVQGINSLAERVSTA